DVKKYIPPRESTTGDPRGEILWSNEKIKISKGGKFLSPEEKLQLKQSLPTNLEGWFGSKERDETIKSIQVEPQVFQIYTMEHKNKIYMSDDAINIVRYTKNGKSKTFRDDFSKVWWRVKGFKSNHDF